ncbi:hypothetical protein [Telmatospirillum sp.]|uniref:aldose epimerase family protein n=1 Tax=Telmatospirillum sp. TaxID=2079197 RepID=UPI0028402655|nr:hypothetical protein [Telmatospirillum sp.]MDR3441010.1 hypothetical protein [Telmatospirillum sp.]
MTSFGDDPYLAVRRAFDAPWPGPRGPRIHLRHGEMTATIYPADGCRLASLTAFGFELLRQWQPGRWAFQYGCFPMIPWVGRMRSGILHFDGKKFQLPVNKPPHAMHGMACFKPWNIIETTPEAAEFEFALADPWPWQGTVRQRFELQDNALLVTLTVASSENTFPAAAGWHPWFRKWIGNGQADASVSPGPEAEALQVSFSADWQEEPGTDELPTGRHIMPRPGPWDDCFGFQDTMNASLVWLGKVSLEMVSSAASMVVYDKQPDAACVEPLSGPPDCVNTAPRLVSPTDPLVVATRWVLSR